MRKKIISILISILFIFTIFSINVFAGNIDDPEITDNEGDAFGYIDIDSVWFYEDENNPDILYISMKINNPVLWHFQQTFAVFWEYNDIKYFCSLHLGFDIGENWTKYSVGRHPINDYYDEFHRNITGTYSISDGIINWEIPKKFIRNPEKNDILTNTWSNAFRRLGIIGRAGFTRYILDALIFRIFGNSMWDYAPDSGYGEDYIIQY